MLNAPHHAFRDLPRGAGVRLPSGCSRRPGGRCGRGFDGGRLCAAALQRWSRPPMPRRVVTGDVLTISFDRKVALDAAAIARPARLYRQRARRSRRQDLPLRAEPARAPSYQRLVRQDRHRSGAAELCRHAARSAAAAAAAAQGRRSLQARAAEGALGRLSEFHPHRLRLAAQCSLHRVSGRRKTDRPLRGGGQAGFLRHHSARRRPG